jgi:hypothetical protein
VSKTDFAKTMQNILKTLETSYGYPIDIEFTVNFRKDGSYQINLLQCRPMQTKGLGSKVTIPRSIPSENILFRSSGNFLGGNISLSIDRIIYVDPKAYCALASQSEKYDIARLVGVLNRQALSRDKISIMLLGPGRWGTTTPSLGVSVSFAEINNITILGEIAFTSENVSPEISFGTHFFQDLVETGIFYVALFPDDREAYVNKKYFSSMPKGLKKHVPQYSKYDDVVKVIDVRERGLKIVADIITQKMVCYFRPEKK